MDEFDTLLTASERDEEYVDQWVVIIKKKIVASGDNLKEILKKVKEEYPDEEPYIAKLPSNRIMVM